MMRRTRLRAYRRTDGTAVPSAAARTQGRNNRNPDSTKNTATPMSIRAKISPT